MELHYRLPLYQFVPKRVQRLLSRHCAIGYYAKGQWEDINLLWRHQFARLFPDACVIMQRVTVWPETMIAYKCDVPPDAGIERVGFSIRRKSHAAQIRYELRPRHVPGGPRPHGRGAVDRANAALSPSVRAFRR